MLQRRAFLKSGTAALVVAGVGPVALFSGSPARGEEPVFTQAQFEGLLESWLQVDDGSWKSVELIEVSGSDAAAELEQFTIVLRGGSNVEIAEGTYSVAPAVGDTFELHLQPAGGDADSNYFTACFSIVKPITTTSGCAG
jgi:hypothetical protein